VSDAADRLLEEIVDRVVGRLEPLLAVGPAEPWRLLDVGEAAALLGRSRSWVQKAVRPVDRGGRGLPHVRLDGGGLMFDPEDLRAFALARRVPAVDGGLRAGRVQLGSGTGVPPRDRSVEQKAGRA
jgi:Helix-turn-helix domain